MKNVRDTKVYKDWVEGSNYLEVYKEFWTNPSLQDTLITVLHNKEEDNYTICRFFVLGESWGISVDFSSVSLKQVLDYSVGKLYRELEYYTK